MPSINEFRSMSTDAVITNPVALSVIVENNPRMVAEFMTVVFSLMKAGDRLSFNDATVADLRTALTGINYLHEGMVELITEGFDSEHN